MGPVSKRQYAWKTFALAAMIAIGIVLAVAGCGSAKEDAAKAANETGVAAVRSDANPMAARAAEQLKQAQEQAGTTADAQVAAKDRELMASLAPASPAASPNGLATPDGNDGLNRKIIYKANVTMEVEDYGTAHTQINNLIHLSGGYLIQFSENRTDYEQSGTLIVKVPTGGFSGFLADLEKMKPKSIQRSVQGQDVTEEFVDLESRLKAKQTEEARLLAFMEKASKTDELVAFSNQLGKIQEEIEKIKGRMRYLEQNVTYSTIEIRLYQKIAAPEKKAQEEPAAGFSEKLKRAVGGSASVVLGFFQGLLIVLAASLPVLGVLAVFGIPVWLIVRHRKQQQARWRDRSQQIRRENLASLSAEPEQSGETAGHAGERTESD